jgi:hypothetical protein
MAEAPANSAQALIGKAVADAFAIEITLSRANSGGAFSAATGTEAGALNPRVTAPVYGPYPQPPAVTCALGVHERALCNRFHAEVAVQVGHPDSALFAQLSHLQSMRRKLDPDAPDVHPFPRVCG